MVGAPWPWNVIMPAVAWIAALAAAVAKALLAAQP